MFSNQIQRNKERKNKMNSDFVFGLDRVGIKNGFVASFLLLIIGITWLIIGLNADYVFYYPLILILMGITALIIAIFNSVKRSMMRDQSIEEDPEILDSEQVK
ncbi:MAG: hypothetical protein MK105_10735 [Crocinitomicaceae bacterium]|nr:hypothetical protein [Crocinitomicaceae bacterium]